MFLFLDFILSTHHWIYVAFGSVLLVFLLLDLGIFQQKDKEPTYQSSLLQTGLWFLIAMCFGGVLFFFQSKETATQFLSGYLMEWSLSADNIFVFILILKYFSIPTKSHQRVLFWGIIGAIIFRGIFITLGSGLVERFHWILYLFGVLLVYTGFKMLKESNADEEPDYSPDKNFIYKWLQKNFRFSGDTSLGVFWFKENNQGIFTPLFLVICLIATTDVMFAIDSIPAVFAISTDKLVIYSSNVFAVMGLRAMFFTLSSVIKKFDYLQQGISFILVFIGAKMLLEIFDVHLSSLVSLAVIVAMLFGSILLSIILKKKEN